ncbi:MAG: hypothetical protein M0035_07330 [Actinomycetota bacterium]|nr:hypothetical protein [Actinomycetota bacterium]
MSVEHAVNQQAGVVVDDQEQLGPHRGLHPWMRHERSDQDVGHPPFVRSGRLIAAEGLGLGHEGLFVQSGPAQLVAHGALGDPDAMAGEQDPGDLGC